MKESIQLKVIDADEQHIMFAFDRPGRVEISVVHGKLIAHVYDGSEVDPQQLTLMMFDGTVDNSDLGGIISPPTERGYGAGGEGSEEKRSLTFYSSYRDGGTYFGDDMDAIKSDG